MKTKRFSIAWLIVGVFVGGALLAGCNTWKGAGKDIEDTGEAMQGD